MPSDKLIHGNRITDDDPLQVTITGADAVMSNAGTPTKVSVGTSSTTIVSADPARTWGVLVTIYAGGPVFVHEAGPATTNDFPIATGVTINHASTRALNGIVSTGTADVRTWPNGGAA